MHALFADDQAAGGAGIADHVEAAVRQQRGGRIGQQVGLRRQRGAGDAVGDPGARDVDADALGAQAHHVVLDRLLRRQQHVADLGPPMATPVEPDAGPLGRRQASRHLCCVHHGPPPLKILAVVLSPMQDDAMLYTAWPKMAQWPGSGENSAISMGDRHMGQARTFRYGVFVVGAVAVMLCTAAGEAADSVTVASFGGAYSASQKKAYTEPFQKETGTVVNMTDYNGGLGEIRAQVEAGNVTWDVVDVEMQDAVRGCDDGLFEPLTDLKLPAAPDGTKADDDFRIGTMTD